MILPVLTLVLAVAPYVSRIVRADPARGARQRLRRAGPAQGHPREGGDAQARAAQRDRPRHPGDRPPARLAGRRRRLRRDVFAYPGVGFQLVDAVRNHDVPVVQALSMIIAGVYVVVNLVADLLSILLTPRARTAI